MLSQFLNQMDERLSNKPFKRRWWSRPWIVHMTIQPPISKNYPLWKHSKDELRFLRLFDLSPEALRQKIERYWKKPRWRRWFGSFGMNKKIDVWNYYQRCLAYKTVRSDKLKQESFIISENKPLEDLVLILHQSNIKFEAYLEKHCRNSKWAEKYFSKKIKAYKQQLKKIFFSTLNKSLQQIKTEGDRFILKQQAELEFQQVEAFMFHYHSLWLNSLFPRITHTNERVEAGMDVIQNGSLSQNRELSMGNQCLATDSLSPSTIPKTTIYKTDITLHRSKEWIQAQREQLKLLLKEGSLQKVEKLLEVGLNDIKTITERHLSFCDSMLADVQDKKEPYQNFLNFLDNLQRQLKPLLQGGMLLFHPDHLLNLTDTQAMRELITRYSQAYLEQNRRYLDSFKNYHLRIEEFHLLDQQKLQKQHLSNEWSDLAQRIQELAQSVKELEHSFKKLEQSVKELTKKLNEFDVKRVLDKEAIDNKLMKFEAKLDKLFAYSIQQKQASTSDLNMPTNVRNLTPEVGVDIVQEGNKVNSENNLVLHTDSKTACSFQSGLSREMSQQSIIGSLDGAKEWIQKQIERLKPLLEENSLQKVKELLQTSLKEIAETTELCLNFCEIMLSDIQSEQKDYDYFLKYVDNLQRQLKPLLQGGIRLFHSDHMMGLIQSKEMWETVTQFSQVYLEQSRCYLDRLKNYHLRIEDFYQQSQQKFQKQQSPQDWSDLVQYILELGQSVKDLEQSFKELDEKLKEFETKRVQDKAETAIELAQYKAETNKKIKEIEIEIQAYLKTKQKIKFNQNENLENNQESTTNSTERPSSRR